MNPTRDGYDRLADTYGRQITRVQDKPSDCAQSVRASCPDIEAQTRRIVQQACR